MACARACSSITTTRWETYCEVCIVRSIGLAAEFDGSRRERLSSVSANGPAPNTRSGRPAASSALDCTILLAAAGSRPVDRAAVPDWGGGAGHRPRRLHRREAKVRGVPAAHRRAVSDATLSQGAVSYRGAAGQLVDEARAEQREEADGGAHRQALLRDHPPADGSEPGAGAGGGGDQRGAARGLDAYRLGRHRASTGGGRIAHAPSERRAVAADDGRARIRLSKREDHRRVPGRRADQRRQGQLQFVCDQEEGRDRAGGQGEPLKRKELVHGGLRRWATRVHECGGHVAAVGAGDACRIGRSVPGVAAIVAPITAGARTRDDPPLSTDRVGAALPASVDGGRAHRWGGRGRARRVDRGRERLQAAQCRGARRVVCGHLRAALGHRRRRRHRGARRHRHGEHSAGDRAGHPESGAGGAGRSANASAGRWSATSGADRRRRHRTGVTHGGHCAGRPLVHEHCRRQRGGQSDPRPPDGGAGRAVPRLRIRGQQGLPDAAPLGAAECARSVTDASAHLRASEAVAGAAACGGERGV
eukprot:ctg_1033.g442